jgi:hypothetical protein
MSPYQEAIFDRTAEDVENETAKAFFNVADWLRVYGNASIAKSLIALLLEIDIVFNPVAAPTITTIPTVEELNTLLLNIERIRLASGLPEIEGLAELKTDWTAGSSADAPDYLDANEWERVIDVLFYAIGRSVEYRVYCGVSAVGQPRFYQHRWRQFAGWIPPSETPVRRARTGVAAAGQGLTRNNGFRRYD